MVSYTNPSPLDKATFEARKVNEELIRLKKVLENTPEYKAVKKQEKLWWEAQGRVNQLINESNREKVKENIPSLKEAGYECRTGHSTDSSSYNYVICKSDTEEIVHLCSGYYGVEGFSHDYNKCFDCYSFLGCGETEDEAWEEAVSNIDRA